MIMAYDFAAIRQQFPLGEIAAKDVRLKPQSGNRIGCCPFHPDRTPSFVIYGEETFHCFGCGAHGDVIDYVSAKHAVDMGEAIRILTGGAAPQLNEQDRDRRRAERSALEALHRKQQQSAIDAARLRWERASPVNGGGSAYLERKGVAPYGCRTERDGLLVPIMDAQGLVQSVQFIPDEPGAKKLFHPGAPVGGGRYVIGDNEDGPLVVAEGFATSATVQEATGFQVAVAFSKGNIAAIVSDYRQRHPGRTIIIAADTDAEQDAFALAEKYGVRVAVPEMEGAEGSDFNDQAGHYGIDDVRRVFARFVEATETPLPLVWYGDIQPVLNGNWIVKNTIPAEAFVTIIGHPGCGKSFGALDLALHIGAGMEWQGRKVKRGLVVYLAAEGQRGQMNRVEAWRRHHQVSELDFAMIPVAINLRDREADVPKLMETINAAVQQAGLPLICLFVDTLNRTFGGGDENGAEMTDYVDNVGRLKAAFGCTAVIVHHIPKNAETITERGHGSLRGAIETSLLVQADAETGIRTLKCTKQKDAEDGWSLQFKLKVVELGVDEDGDPVTSCVVEETDAHAPNRHRGPHLSPTQRQVYNELLATLEASSVGVPRDIPPDMINTARVGKVVKLSTWRERWMAIVAADMEADSARRTFRRAITDLQNKGLVGVWNDHAWANHE